MKEGRKIKEERKTKGERMDEYQKRGKKGVKGER